MPCVNLLRDLHSFCLYIKSERGLALNTVEAYERDLERFVDFLEERGVAAVMDIHSEHIVEHLAFLDAANYAKASICRALMAIKVFCRFLKREQRVNSNVALYLDSPKLWQVLPNVLSGSEVDCLFALPDTTSGVGVRDLAILEVLYGAGLRVSELCGLTIYDVDDEYVKVKGKGSKERLVPIGKKAIDAVDHYLIQHRPQAATSVLFLTERGRSIDRIAVWRMIKDYGKKAGIAKKISPHTLRHSFATHLLDNGADIRIIQEMMGHADISSTDRYLHLSRAKIQASFQRYHPKGECS